MGNYLKDSQILPFRLSEQTFAIQTHSPSKSTGVWTAA